MRFRRKLNVLAALVIALLFFVPAIPIAESEMYENERIFGSNAGDFFGSDIAAGCVHSLISGSTPRDTIIGANQSLDGPGYVEIHFGGDEYDGEPDVTITGEIDGDQFGFALAVDDFNDDMIDDIAIGAPYADASFYMDTGKVYVFYGREEWPGTLDASDANITIDGIASNQNLGFSLASGLINYLDDSRPDEEDFYYDLVIGAPYFSSGGTEPGNVYVFNMGPWYGDGTHSANDANSTLGGHTNGGNFGFSMVGSIDFDDDDNEDVCVGEPWNSGTNGVSGAAFIYYGGENVDNTADVILAGESDGDRFGWSVNNCGDVDRSGTVDLVVGAPYYNPGTTPDAGRAYLYYGGSEMTGEPDFTFDNPSPQSDDHFGFHVDYAGDLNNDGPRDFGISTPSVAVYLYYGGSQGDMDTKHDDIIENGDGSDNLLGYRHMYAFRTSGSGTHEIIVSGPHDTDGSSGSVTGSVSFYVAGGDVYPEIEVTEPDQQGEKPESNGLYEIKWEASDKDNDDEDLEISLYYRNVNGGALTLIESGLDNTGSYWWDTTEVERGEYIITAEVKDPDGHASTDDSEGTVAVKEGNGLGPMVEVTDPDEDLEEPLNHEYTIRWEASDPDNDDEDILIDIYSRNKDTGSNRTIATGEDNDGRFVWDSEDWDKNQEYYIVIRARDPQENGAWDESEGTVWVGDNHDPEVSIEEPGDYGTEWRGTHTVKWEGSDPDGDKVEYAIYLEHRQEGDMVHLDNISATDETSHEFTHDFSDYDGQYYIVIEANDHNGSIITEDSIWFKIDNTPPVTSDDNDGEWVSMAVVELDVDDTERDSTRSGSGMNNGGITYYSIDGSDPTLEYSESEYLVIEETGEYTLKYYSVDDVGNEEEVKTAEHPVRVDAEEPYYGDWQMPSLDSGSSMNQYFEVIIDDNLSGLKEGSISLDYYIGDEEPDYKWETIDGDDVTFHDGNSTASATITGVDWNDTEVREQWLHVRWYCLDKVFNRATSVIRKDFIEDVNKPDISVSPGDILVKDSGGAELDTAGIGDRVTIQAVVKNAGNVEGDARVEFFVDDGARGDISIGTRNIAVPAGGHKEVSMEWDTDGYAAGDRTISVEVSCDEDGNSGNDRASITFPLYSKPDATITGLSFELDGEATTIAFRDGEVILKATVENDGGTDAENVFVRFYLDEMKSTAQIGTDVDIGTVAPGESKVASYPWQVGDLMEGQYRIFAGVFSDEDYDTESNNIVVEDLDIQSAAAADIRISKSNIAFKVNGVDAFLAQPGDTVTIEIEAENVGDADSGNIDYEIRKGSEDGELIDSGSGSIDAGATEKFTVTWDTINEETGSLEIYIIISGDALQEDLIISNTFILRIEGGGGGGNDDDDSPGFCAALLPAAVGIGLVLSGRRRR